MKMRDYSSLPNSSFPSSTKLMRTTTDAPARPTKNMTSSTRIANIAIGMRLIVSRILPDRPARCLKWNCVVSMRSISGAHVSHRDRDPGCYTLAPVCVLLIDLRLGNYVPPRRFPPDCWNCHFHLRALCRPGEQCLRGSAWCRCLPPYCRPCVSRALARCAAVFCVCFA